MAILDANLVLSDGQAITATALSTNTIKLPSVGTVPLEAGAMSVNLGAGVPLPMLLQVTETFAALTSLTITLETSANEDMSSSTVLATSGAIALANLTAGATLPAFPAYFPSGDVLEYVALRYTVGGSAATAGKITAAVGSTQDAGNV